MVTDVRVNSSNVAYLSDHLVSSYDYNTVDVQTKDGVVIAQPATRKFKIRTERNIPKTGLMIVGLGGNNGTTLYAGILSNKKKLSWNTKEGVQTANYYGSITQASTVRLGSNAAGEDVYVPLKSLIPMIEPEALEISGWDISSLDLGEAMRRARVLDYDVQRQLYDEMKGIKPLPSVYFPEFIAMNQFDRADNVLTGSKWEQMEQIRADIRHFKESRGLAKVIVLWSANTEKFTEVVEGKNDTADNLLASIRAGDAVIAPSTLYCVASILEGCSYINGSPQNTFVNGVVELAVRHGTFLVGDDFKSGQTKLKSTLVDYLIGAGIKPVSIVSYNHLGNNDGKNLVDPDTFKSKELSKSNVVDDVVDSNPILYDTANKEHPDHVVVIKYVPYVGDSKRAMDEYTSEIFMGGRNTIVIHNTCEDSLLAAPLMLDLVTLTEMSERVAVMEEGKGAADFQKMHTSLSLLSYLCKAPHVPSGTPVVNALFRQRDCIVNFLRACVGLAPDSSILLEHKLPGCGTPPFMKTPTQSLVHLPCKHMNGQVSPSTSTAPVTPTPSAIIS